MKCGFCDHTDGLCYASNPPRVKCNITGKYRFYGSDCDALVAATMAPLPKNMKSVPCLICGEGVDAELHELNAKICEKCREAVLKVRADLGRDPCEPILD